MSKFFIDRPIFAWVIALVIMLAGGLSILSLPVNQYPAIAPPAIAVQVSYPGASAETVQDTVVQVIEQQMNGIDNLRYISSESNSDGSMTITVTFEQGTDPDIAQVQVQNKLQLATPLLPQEVQRQGIRVTKAVKNFLILGEPAPGLSSGDAMAAVEEIVKQLPKGVGYSWTGLSYEERLSGSQAPALYALSLLVVFLCLAALYESWSIPFSVMLVVPLGVIGALLATSMRGLSNDVFFQVGLLTTIGLSAKNAILIVEFAKELHEQGKGIVEAAIEACRMRLRPIVMTSLAFILGVVPLAISTGAGSGSQHAIGTGVIGGMVTATVLAIFWVPLFYVAVSTLFKDEASKQQASVEKGQ